MGPAREDLFVTDDEFEIVKIEIAATLHHAGVPPRKHRELMDFAATRARHRPPRR